MGRPAARGRTNIRNSVLVFPSPPHHHSALLNALEVPSIEYFIEKQRIGLLKRTFRMEIPYTDLVIFGWLVIEVEYLYSAYSKV